ncbi:MAG: 2-C-methyl-D-erythritol 2,4-cyclodiphosphate synthase [Bacillota bacterium]|jgi:2-C-methyl-D-erythritol 2,4-cyclodiphosphate synthase|nr:2-C-methyl-D-erythritol 2,4-cyclodiphosphate synthase [Bacillota bacterium]NLL26321.1 2-C-methyl-D-erythritol 2,4-cyclodiphosphate synthase [Erysipelotrichia bacterium]
MRIGQAIDIHQLVENRDLILGGVKIEHEKGLLGHSDADVLLHAIAEAIIGALGLGDLGTHFPDTDEKYKGISSMILLAEVEKLMVNHNYEIGNIDSTILIEEPKLVKYKEEMEKNIAEVLKCDVSQVNVKATRGEKLGFVGEKKGVAALATVVLKEREKVEYVHI